MTTTPDDTAQPAKEGKGAHVRNIATATALLISAITGFAGAASPASAGTTADQIVKIRPLHTTNKCLDVQDGSHANSANLIQYDCTGATNQRFRLIRVSGNDFEIRPTHVTGKCLDIQGGSPALGARVIQFDCTGASNQRFALDNGGSSLNSIRPRHVFNMCFDVPSAGTANSVNIIQFTCKGGARNQLFEFLPTL
ncbi:RICIN domain-containing protein [Streptosporangium sp. H16]|uniref:RICIN domain-containing protein n=1 Tax=Streptosporangium sp. H16 TaxID=3444184 RepID=UPI003F793D90